MLNSSWVVVELLTLCFLGQQPIRLLGFLFSKVMQNNVEMMNTRVKPFNHILKMFRNVDPLQNLGREFLKFEMTTNSLPSIFKTFEPFCFRFLGHFVCEQTATCLFWA